MAPTFCKCCGNAVEEGFDPLYKLAELDALSERLRLERYDLKRKINQFHSPIVRRLPPDVTSTIFEFCLPDFADHRLFYYPKEDPFKFIPLSLGAICSYWREIAWSTPSLWSSLVVRLPGKRGSHIVRVISIAQEWLARSGQLPLSIRIYSRFYNKTVSALADIINQYSTRWSELDLYVPEQFYQQATDNHAPILKFIRFRGSVDGTYLNFQLTCPRLERANLSSFPMNGTNIQWDNLTHLTLNFMSITDSFLILRKTPRLVFCKASFLQSGGVGEIVLTSLRSLRSLQLEISSLARRFLDNIIAPHLEEFSLPDYYNPSMEDITSFLRRSACSLRSFSILLSFFPPHFEKSMDLLQSMSSLNTLSITTTVYFEDTAHEDYDPRNILQLVAKVLSSQSTSQQGFLPNLKILEYTGKLRLRSGNYGDLYSLLPPADNAVHGPLHLLKLNLYPAARIPKDMISYISSLVERGVTVKVLSRSEDILQSSIDYYRCRNEFLCRDWTDNFDSSLFS
jgi:hypothetical protein